MAYLGLVAGVCVLASACSTDLGPCDPTAARAVAYDQGEVPAYEGQALMRVSCGNGGYCHSALAAGGARFGVPLGLDFDMAVASRDEGYDEEAAGRLGRGRAHVVEHAESIYDAVESGVMPPFGRATITAHADLPRYRRAGLAGSEAHLPAVDSAEGVELLRNWLSCGAPIVERVDAHPMGVSAVGDVVPRRR